jgi:hypothetical protein
MINFNPFTQYIMGVLNTTDLVNVCVYGSDAVPGWAYAKEVVTNVATDAAKGTVEYSRTQPRGIDASVNGIDLNRVSIWMLKLTYASNTTDTHVELRLNYKHVAFAEAQSQIDSIYTAIGGPQAAPVFARLEKHSDMAYDNVYAVRDVPSSLYLKKSFIHTMALINEANLMNGILKLPPALCEEMGLSKRATICLPHGAKTKIEFETYYAIPADHILAWNLHMTHHQRKRYGMYAYEYYVPDNNRLLYYIVGDVCADSSIASCVSHWMGPSKIDIRPLYSVAPIYIPVGTAGSDIGPLTPDHNVKLTMHMGFTGFPTALTPEDITRVAPTFHPDFPPFTTSAAFIGIRDEDIRIYQEKLLEDKIKNGTV